MNKEKEMKKKTIAELKKEKKIIDIKRRKLSDVSYEIEEEIKRRQTIPKMLKMVGNCYEHTNCYGNEKKWPYFLRIIGVLDSAEFIAEIIEKDIYGETRYYHHKTVYHSSIKEYKKITLNKYKNFVRQCFEDNDLLVQISNG